MKKIIVKMFLFFVFSFVVPAHAHHTKEHTMLMDDTEQIITATQQGAGGPWVWLVWLCVVCLFAFGLWRWLRNE